MLSCSLWAQVCEFAILSEGKFKFTRSSCVATTLLPNTLLSNILNSCNSRLKPTPMTYGLQALHQIWTNTFILNTTKHHHNSRKLYWDSKCEFLRICSFKWIIRISSFTTMNQIFQTQMTAFRTDWLFPTLHIKFRMNLFKEADFPAREFKINLLDCIWLSFL